MLNPTLQDRNSHFETIRQVVKFGDMYLTKTHHEYSYHFEFKY